MTGSLLDRLEAAFLVVGFAYIAFIIAVAI
jgi:hypothetical protein